MPSSENIIVRTWRGSGRLRLDEVEIWLHRLEVSGGLKGSATDVECEGNARKTHES